ERPPALPPRACPAKEPAVPASVAPKAEAPAPAAESAEGAEQGRTSPLVRKMAKENNLDLSQVTGTGAGGRITKEDVVAYMTQPGGATKTAPAPAPARSTP